MVHTAGKFIAPILDALEPSSSLKLVMVICSWKISQSMRSYHVKLNCGIQDQRTLRIQKSVGLEHPLTFVSRCILVTEKISSTALVADLDLESLCNPLFMSISCEQEEHGLCQDQHKQQHSFIFMSNM